jgi:hypothetical protein
MKPVEPIPIGYTSSDYKRVRPPRLPGQKGQPAYIYDIEGEWLTAVEIAERLNIGASATNSRLAKGQRTWAQLRQNDLMANRERMRRQFDAEYIADAARKEAIRNGRLRGGQYE